jgi:hypothetical protein
MRTQLHTWVVDQCAAEPLHTERGSRASVSECTLFKKRKDKDGSDVCMVVVAASAKESAEMVGVVVFVWQRR